SSSIALSSSCSVVIPYSFFRISISSSTSIPCFPVKNLDSNAAQLTDRFGEFIEVRQDLFQLRLLVLRDDAISRHHSERVLALRQDINAKACQKLNANSLNPERLV